MAGFFDRMLGRGGNKGSGSTAKDRLKMVLVHDRIQIAPEKLREMKAEIIAVIAKYVPSVDPDSVDIALEPTDRYNNKLVAEIPFTQQQEKDGAISDEADDETIPHARDSAEHADALPINTQDDEATVRVKSTDEDELPDDPDSSA